MIAQNDFALSTITQVNTICAPFFKEFKLISFNYAKLYYDKSLLAVHSDPNYASLYLELNCPPIPRIPLDYWQSDSFYFLPKGGDDTHYNHLLKQSTLRFNCDNPLFFISKTKNYLEVAVFCSYLEDKNAINRYLNHLKEFNLFVEYFRIKTNDLFQQASNDRLYLPAPLYPCIPENISYASSQPDYTEFYKRLNNKLSVNAHMMNQISQREMQCLYYLCKGYRYKDIANQLTISDRTVESHITNAKKKLNITSRSKLVNALAQFID